MPKLISTHGSIIKIKDLGMIKVPCIQLYLILKVALILRVRLALRLCTTNVLYGLAMLIEHYNKKHPLSIPDTLLVNSFPHLILGRLTEKCWSALQSATVKTVEL